MWKLKSRVSNPHDLMAGAGGVAPPAATAKAETSSSSPATTAAPEGPPATSSASPADAPSDSADTGEAASSEALEAIKGRLHALKWKAGYLRVWFAEHFGITGVQEPARILGALTQQQADNVFLLLNAGGAGTLYTRLLDDMRAKGQAK